MGTAACVQTPGVSAGKFRESRSFTGIGFSLLGFSAERDKSIARSAKDEKTLIKFDDLDPAYREILLRRKNRCKGEIRPII